MGEAADPQQEAERPDGCRCTERSRFGQPLHVFAPAAIFPSRFLSVMRCTVQPAYTLWAILTKSAAKDIDKVAMCGTNTLQ
jgi:hypothetical protein